MADVDHVARLTADAPAHDEVVALLVDAFTGCDPDVLASAPADETETSAA